MCRKSFFRSVCHLTVACLIVSLAAQSLVAQPVRSDLPVQSFVGSLTTELQDDFIRLALSSPEYVALQKSIREWQPRLRTQSHAARAVEASGMVGVFVPVAGGEEHSSISLWFDGVGRSLLHTASSLFDRTDSGDISVSFVLDGVERLAAKVSEEGHLLQGTLFDADGLPAKDLNASDWAAAKGQKDCLGDCLDSLGVPGWAFGVYLTLCGFVCGSTLGVGCVACAVGIGFGYLYQVGYCTGQCAR